MMQQSTKIKIAIAGLGNITHGYEDDPLIARDMRYPTHLSVLRDHPAYELIAGCDINTENIRRFSAKIDSKVSLYSDHRNMLARTIPDVLVVASSTASHVEIGMDAIEAGVKCLFCEKPLSYDLEEATRLARKAEQKGVLLAVNYMRAFDAGYRQMLRRIESGEWGEVRGITAKYGGGAYNNATHLIDLMLRIAGKPRMVCGQATAYHSLNERDPILDITIMFETGPNAHLQGFSGKDYDIFELDILLSHARIVIGGDRSRFHAAVPSIRVSNAKELVESDQEFVPSGIGRSYYDAYDNISRAILQKEALLCTADDAIRAIRTVDAAVRSSRENRGIVLFEEEL